MNKDQVKTESAINEVYQGLKAKLSPLEPNNPNLKLLLQKYKAQ